MIVVARADLHLQSVNPVDQQEELERLQNAFNEVTRQAGLASAPERFATGPSLNDLERAWLDGRDDTVQHIVGDLSGLIDELVVASLSSSSETEEA